MLHVCYVKQKDFTPKNQQPSFLTFLAPEVSMYSKLCLKFICSDCHAKDSEGKRPLHFAAYGKGSLARDVVGVLIEKGATEIGEFTCRFGIIGLHGMQTDLGNLPS